MSQKNLESPVRRLARICISISFYYLPLSMYHANKIVTHFKGAQLCGFLHQLDSIKNHGSQKYTYASNEYEYKKGKKALLRNIGVKSSTNDTETNMVLKHGGIIRHVMLSLIRHIIISPYFAETKSRLLLLNSASSFASPPRKIPTPIQLSGAKPIKQRLRSDADEKALSRNFGFFSSFFDLTV